MGEAEFTAFAVQYSPDAKETRRKLAPELQVELLNVVDRLADDPDAFPGQTRKVGRSGTVFIYTHASPPLEITYEVDRRKRLLFLLHFAAPVFQAAKPLFISYSHKDAQWLAKLRAFLSPLEDQGLIRVWADSEIQAGMDWLAEIRKSLESARVAVLLVSQDFLTSRFIKQEEMPSLLEGAKQRGLVIFWIAVSSCTFQDSVIARYQAANDPKQPLDMLSKARQNKVFSEIYQKLRAVLDPGPRN